MDCTEYVVAESKMGPHASAWDTQRHVRANLLRSGTSKRIAATRFVRPTPPGGRSRQSCPWRGVGSCNVP
eukprot:2178804-Pleurochrysis_carterae.AAC.2